MWACPLFVRDPTSDLNLIQSHFASLYLKRTGGIIFKRRRRSFQNSVPAVATQAVTAPLSPSPFVCSVAGERLRKEESVANAATALSVAVVENRHEMMMPLDVAIGARLCTL